MRLALLAALALRTLAAQDCPAVARIDPAGTITGSLDAAACVLNDGSAYIAYRLDLPTRGVLSLQLTADAGLQLMLRDAAGARLESGASLHRSLEAGEYRVLVNGRTPGQTGAFTVAAAFTAEPSMLCAAFPRIGLRQTIANTLGSYGCTAPDGTPYDAWLLTTYAAGALAATIDSADFVPTLVLRGSDGRVLATAADGMLAAPLEAGSRYYLVAASTGRSGSYRLTTSFEEVGDDPCHATAAFNGSSGDNGVITAAGCYATLPGSGDPSSYNYYSIALDTAGAATFSVASGDFVPSLYLLDAAGNTLAADSLSGGYDLSGNASSYLRAPLPPGRYLLLVASDVASGGQYQLQYGYKPDPLPACTVTPVTPGDGQSGVLAPASCRTASGLTDLYSFTLNSPGTLELDLAAPDFPATLAIRDLKDNLIVRSGSHISAALPAGVYTVAVSADSSAGAYQLTSGFAAHEIPPCTFTQTIDLNGGYIQRLGPASCTGGNGQPVDYYGFTLSADSMVLGVVTSSEVDGYLTLLDAGGNVLRSDDNSYSGSDPLFVQYLPAGAYKVAVRDASATTGGLYEVDLRTVEGARPVFCAARGALQPDSPVSGNITYTGCQYTDGTFADLYQFTVAADSTVDLRLNSEDFDAYLIVLDAKGSVVEEDDDGDGGTNSRITIPLAAGTYYVVAKPSGDYLAHGVYTLSAQLADSSGG